MDDNQIKPPVNPRVQPQDNKTQDGKTQEKKEKMKIAVLSYLVSWVLLSSVFSGHLGFFWRLSQVTEIKSDDTGWPNGPAPVKLPITHDCQHRHRRNFRESARWT
ncbi:MAG: hypothetical protein WCP35_09600 [Verrucomicrobiota bacterium]